MTKVHISLQAYTQHMTANRVATRVFSEYRISDITCICINDSICIAYYDLAKSIIFKLSDTSKRMVIRLVRSVDVICGPAMSRPGLAWVAQDLMITFGSLKLAFEGRARSSGGGSCRSGEPRCTKGRFLKCTNKQKHTPCTCVAQFYWKKG